MGAHKRAWLIHKCFCFSWLRLEISGDTIYQGRGFIRYGIVFTGGLNMLVMKMLLAATATVGLGLGGQSADAPKGDAVKAKKEAKQTGATLGTVERVDASTKQIFVRVGKKKDVAAMSVVVSWNDQTKFEKATSKTDRSAATAADVTAGARVIVKKDDKGVASLVTLVPKDK